MTEIIPGKTKRFRWLWLTGALFLFAIPAVLVWNRNLATKSVDPLNVTERAWLKTHPVIRLAPDPDFPPVEYFTGNGAYSGITADYVALLEKKLGIRIEIVRLRNWDEIISKAKSRQIDVYVATGTPQRAEYLLFTQHFLEFPAVIIAREKAGGPLSMEKLHGKKVSVVSEYAAQNFIAYNYPELNLDLVPDVETGLERVSFGLSDAFVENLATATYFIEKKGITNLRIAGESGYFYRMGFCTRKDWPELNSILEKGLAGISAGERKAIYRKWIPMEPGSPFASKAFRTGLLAAVTAILLMVAGVIVWNRALARQVRLRTGELEKELAERKLVQEKLRFTQFAVDNTVDQAFWMTEDGCLFYVNDAVCRALEYTREELIGMSVPNIDPNYQPEMFAEHWRELQQNGHVKFETVHRAKDGRVYPVEVRANHVVFDGKEYNCAFATDISERKRAEEALRESEEKFRVLAETSPVAIIVYQGEKNVYVNPKATRMIGYTEQECLEMNFWDWTHDDFKEVVKYRGLARQQGEPMPPQYEFKCVTKGGEEKWVVLSAGRIEYEGAPAGIVSIFDITDRKRMEEELQHARDELEKRVDERTRELAETVQTLRFTQFAVDRCSDQAFWLTSDGRFLYVNDAACHSLGYTRDELVTMSVPEINPTCPPDEFPPYWSVLCERGTYTFETLHRAKDGRIYPVEIRANLLIFDNKEYCCCFVTDITERKQAEEALLLSQFCIDKAGIGIYQCDHTGTIYSVNEQACKSLGYSREEVCALNVFDIDPEITREKMLELKEILDEKGTVTHCTTHKRKDGTTFPVEITATQLLFQGKTLGISFVKDITERKRAIAELERTQFLVDKSSIGIHRISGEGNILYANEYSCRTLGYTPEELCSMTVLDIDPTFTHEKFREHRKTTHAAGSRTFESLHRRKDGSTFPVEVTVTCLKSQGNEMGFNVSFAKDITERKRAEEKLQRQKQLLQELNDTLEKRVEEEVGKNREKDIMLIQQNRQAALGEMLDHIAHQWKQPLNSISLIVQELEESSLYGELTNEIVGETVGKTIAMVQHMAQTIDTFRGFYRPDKERKVFNIKESIDQALAFIAPAFRFYSIAVELDVDPGLTAFGYPKEYAQVLLNILANARDVFMSRATEKPRVIVRAFAEGNNAVVTIEDNGGGIPEAIKERIFDFYFTTNEADGGTGIGLYMSRNIIEKNMGGKLSAENTDIGARFRIEISPT
jgi:PAS domain S-box-containing protein